MSTKSQSLFSTVVSSFSMFTGRLFLLICIKVDSYNCIPIAFFFSDHLPFGLYFIIYLAIFLSFRCIRTIFSTFPVLILSNNSFGKFSPVKLTFCVFSWQKYFFEILNFQTRHVRN